MTNVAGGHASMGIRVLGEGEPLVDAGKVRVLSILDSKRCKFYPDVPTAKEEGFAVQTYEKICYALFEEFEKARQDEPVVVRTFERLKLEKSAP